MERRSPGSTTASRIKSLHLAVLEQRGRAAAQEFFARAGIGLELVEDETRIVPFDSWCRALAEFERLCGPGSIKRTTPYFVHRENLGVWTRLLRGATSIGDVYRQLDQLGTDRHGRREWTTHDVDDHSWRGFAPLARAMTVRNVEHVTQARIAELACLPQLFGIAPATVTFQHAPEEGGTFFESRWSAPLPNAPSLGSLLAITLAFPLGSALNLAPLPWLAGLGGGALLGCAAGWGARKHAAGRAHANAQMLRIQALERAAELRERRDGSGFEAGTVIAGQFRIGEQIGFGAAGAVWEAVRISDGCQVAIKLLRTAVAHDSLAADRLRREAAALGLAWHPNVVEILDEGHLASGVAYIVMERLHGESLAQRIDRTGPLTPDELHDIALEICDALEAVHAAGVVHRDIKPSNLFLVEEPSGEVQLKLVDFGVAQIAWAETRLTRAGSALGTPGYMAPEQEEGGVVDGRSDLYSLGGVFYEALTGRPPPILRWQPSDDHPAGSFGMPTPSEAGFEHLGSIAPGWRAIIQRLLAPWPHQRFTDARALREALRLLSPEEEQRVSA